MKLIRAFGKSLTNLEALGKSIDTSASFHICRRITNTTFHNHSSFPWIYGEKSQSMKRPMQIYSCMINISNLSYVLMDKTVRRWLTLCQSYCQKMPELDCCYFKLISVYFWARKILLYPVFPHIQQIQVMLWAGLCPHNIHKLKF